MFVGWTSLRASLVRRQPVLAHLVRVGVTRAAQLDGLQLGGGSEEPSPVRSGRLVGRSVTAMAIVAPDSPVGVHANAE
jgi:hypothetical protein